MREDPVDILTRAGWTEVRQRKHRVWKCPCGKHQVSFSKTGSDWRSCKNTVSDIRKTGCPSVAALFVEPEPESKPYPDDMPLVCCICKKPLIEEMYGREWAFHDGVMAHLHHEGMRSWHREGCRKERQSEKTDLDAVL